MSKYIVKPQIVLFVFQVFTLVGYYLPQWLEWWFSSTASSPWIPIPSPLRPAPKGTNTACVHSVKNVTTGNWLTSVSTRELHIFSIIQAQSFTLFSCHSGVRHIQFYFFHCKQRFRIHQLCSMIDGTGPNTTRKWVFHDYNLRAFSCIKLHWICLSLRGGYNSVWK